MVNCRRRRTSRWKRRTASGLSSRSLRMSLRATIRPASSSGLEDLAHAAFAQPLQQDVRPEEKLLAFSLEHWLAW